jgi:hypothetical protein
MDRQVIFSDIDLIGAVPPHSHGEQWGVVHSARFLTYFRAVDVFAEPDRYRPKRL